MKSDKHRRTKVLPEDWPEEDAQPLQLGTCKYRAMYLSGWTAKASQQLKCLLEEQTPLIDIIKSMAKTYRNADGIVRHAKYLASKYPQLSLPVPRITDEIGVEYRTSKRYAISDLQKEQLLRWGKTVRWTLIAPKLGISDAWAVQKMYRRFAKEQNQTASDSLPDESEQGAYSTAEEDDDEFASLVVETLVDAHQQREFGGGRVKDSGGGDAVIMEGDSDNEDLTDFEGFSD